MKSVYLNFFLVLVLVFLLSQIDRSTTLSFSSILVSGPTPTLTLTPTPTQAPPSRLIVPKLSINSLLEPIGVDFNGQMETPSSFTTLGWYVRAVKPGEQGTAVIDGHYDDVAGQPAIFYNLGELSSGDQIMVVDQTGKELNYKVTESVKLPAESAVEDLYKKDGHKNLILITCAGWWNKSLHSYSHRLVVYARLD